MPSHGSATPDHMHPGGTAGLALPASDPIVDEVRAIRDAYAKSLGYDFDAIVTDLRSRQKQHPERVVSLPPKRVDE